MILVGIGTAAMVILFAGFVVVRSRMAKKNRTEADLAASLEAAKADSGLSVEDAQKDFEARIAGQAGEQSRRDVEALLQLKLPEVQTKKTEAIKKHIAAEAKKDPTAMAQVVRSWLDGENQR
jgi:flagellar biosynthesis/type III secretory pathway M-ring protein FliF/YscJ